MKFKSKMQEQEKKYVREKDYIRNPNYALLKMVNS